MNNHLIITVSRQYGTGGRAVAEQLASKLGVGFYDRELITKAAKNSGFEEKLFEQLDKRATNSFLYSLTMFGTTGNNGMTLNDQLYVAQSNVIREIVEKESCVIVGRCANHVLREHHNKFDFYLYGSIADRVKRIQTNGDYEIEGKSPEAALEKMDKQRSTYYNYYTGKVWGKCDHYDLCVNSGKIGVDHSAKLLQEYVSYFK